ncbi:MAG: hypothetical protein AB1798_20685, partial [Spirochaetota bacterium]
TDHSFSPSLQLSYSLTPEINVRVPFQFIYSIGNLTGKRNKDFSLKAAILGDYTYLKDVYGFGFSLQAEITQGVWEYLYTLQRNIIRCFIVPINHLEIVLKNSLAFNWGNWPFYYDPSFLFESGMRGPVAKSEGTKLLLAGVEPGLRNLISLNLGIINAGAGLIVFLDAGRVFSDFREIRLDSLQMTLGGGLVITLGIPLSLSFTFEYGYNPFLKKGKFYLSVISE